MVNATRRGDGVVPPRWRNTGHSTHSRRGIKEGPDIDQIGSPICTSTSESANMVSQCIADFAKKLRKSQDI